MKQLFVPYELAVLAKEKGFDEDCIGFCTKEGGFILTAPTKIDYYDGGIGAPLYQQLVDWLRRKGVKICEDPVGLWDIYTCGNGTQMYKVHLNLNTSLTEAFKLI